MHLTKISVMQLIAIAIGMIILTITTAIFMSTSTQAQSPADSFDFPLGDDTYAYGPILWRYGTPLTIVEDTQYGIRNPDLGTETTCFGQTWNNIYHAGEDWYRFDKNTGELLDAAKDGDQAIAKSVGNGIVVHVSDDIYPGYAVIIKHILSTPRDDHDKIYSVYMHLANTSVISGEVVNKGTPLGTVLYKDWTGTNPDPDRPSYDSHLHWEMRYFFDGSNIYDSSTSCNDSGRVIAGRGYTYPEHPDDFPADEPYTNSSRFITGYKVYLPLVLKRWPPIPYNPVLNPINNPSYASDYTVDWEPAELADTYTLQEATAPDFSDAVTHSTGANTSWEATGKTPDTYYYRVKATNSWGDSGWSNIEQTTVLPLPGWQTITSQDFEGNFPGSWGVFDNNGNSDGEYEWNKRDCLPYAGNYSGWGVGGGADGATLTCGSDYPPNADSWMRYGPFSLENAIAAELRFKLWLNTEKDLYNEYLFRGASVDGTHFQGYQTSGNTEGWVDKELDLSAVPGLGNLLGQTQVWIALIFISDEDGTTYPEGGYADNIILRKCQREPCSSGREDAPIVLDGEQVTEIEATMIRRH